MAAKKGGKGAAAKNKKPTAKEGNVSKSSSSDNILSSSSGSINAEDADLFSSDSDGIVTRSKKMKEGKLKKRERTEHTFTMSGALGVGDEPGAHNKPEFKEAVRAARVADQQRIYEQEKRNAANKKARAEAEAAKKQADEEAATATAATAAETQDDSVATNNIPDTPSVVNMDKTRMRRRQNSLLAPRDTSVLGDKDEHDSSLLTLDGLDAPAAISPEAAASKSSPQATIETAASKSSPDAAAPTARSKKASPEAQPQDAPPSSPPVRRSQDAEPSVNRSTSAGSAHSSLGKRRRSEADDTVAQNDHVPETQLAKSQKPRRGSSPRSRSAEPVTPRRGGSKDKRGTRGRYKSLSPVIGTSPQSTPEPAAETQTKKAAVNHGSDSGFESGSEHHSAVDSGSDFEPTKNRKTRGRSGKPRDNAKSKSGARKASSTRSRGEENAKVTKSKSPSKGPTALSKDKIQSKDATTPGHDGDPQHEDAGAKEDSTVQDGEATAEGANSDIGPPILPPVHPTNTPLSHRRQQRSRTLGGRALPQPCDPFRRA